MKRGEVVFVFVTLFLAIIMALFAADNNLAARILVGFFSFFGMVLFKWGAVDLTIMKLRKKHGGWFRLKKLTNKEV